MPPVRRPRCATLVSVSTTTEQEHTHRRPRILRHVVLALVVIALVALVIHFIVGLLWAIFYGALILAAIIAALWALKTIIW